MQIRTAERLSGRALYARILERYGSMEALRKAARTRRNAQARLDLVEIELFEEDRRRLNAEQTIEHEIEFEPHEISLLTPARLELLERIARSRTPQNVTQLAAALGRDKKNVSEDLAILTRLGLVEMRRSGREKFPHALANEITIVLGKGEA